MTPLSFYQQAPHLLAGLLLQPQRLLSLFLRDQALLDQHISTSPNRNFSDRPDAARELSCPEGTAAAVLLMGHFLGKTYRTSVQVARLAATAMTQAPVPTARSARWLSDFERTHERIKTLTE